MKKGRVRPPKSASVIVILFGCLFLSFGQVEAGTPKFSLKLGGGPDYLTGGDLNAGIRGMRAFQLDYGAAGAGLFKELHFGAGGGIEILMELTPRLDIAFGLGYFYAARESSTSYVWNSVSFSETVRPRVEVVPLTLGFSYRLAQFHGFRFCLDAGAGFYKGRLAWRSAIGRTVGSVQARQDGEWRASKNALGFQGGIRLEKVLSDSASVYIESVVRYAGFRNLRGDYKVRIFEGAEFREQLGRSTLWAADYLSDDSSYSWLVLSDSKPTARYYVNSRAARIDISGISWKAGIRFRF